MDKLRAMPEYEKGTPPPPFDEPAPEENGISCAPGCWTMQGNQNQLDMYLVPSSKIMQKMEEELRLR